MELGSQKGPDGLEVPGEAPGKSSIRDPGQQNEQTVPERLGPDPRSTKGDFLGMTDGV